MQLVGDNPQEFIAAAYEQLQRNELDSAKSLCERALRFDPQHVDALTLLAVILLRQTQFAQAAPLLLSLTEKQPKEPAHWTNLAMAQRHLKQFDAALGSFQRASSLGEASADFYFNVGLTHLDRCDFEAARATLKRAAELAPADAEICYRYAQACSESLHANEAVAALAGWRNWRLDPESMAGVAQLLMNLGETNQADEALVRLLAHPISSRAVNLIVLQILERTNRLQEAKQLLSKLMAANGASVDDIELTSARAKLAQRESNHQLAHDLFRRALTDIKEVERRHFHLFPLAQSLDALGRYAEAYQCLKDAHASQVRHLELAAPALSARGAPTMVITRHGCDSADVRQWSDANAPSVEASPVFIVAFPRSGTTLLELALDAHPQLRSMDEQPFLQNALDDLIACNVRYPSELGRLRDDQLEEVRQKYWRRTRAKVTLQPGQRLVDKNPLNLLRLPVIRRLFPNSPILLAIRHPCDVILSCFMQHFRAPDFALLCADLTMLTTGYVRSFDFWYEQAALLQPSIRELRYETMVEAFELEMRATIQFLQLSWNDAVLEPGARARDKGFISTPSYSQVVQPVNKRAVGRWRRYAEHFEPVLPLLQRYLERWGYEV